MFNDVVDLSQKLIKIKTIFQNYRNMQIYCTVNTL